MSSNRDGTGWHPDCLDVIETLFLLTGVRPSRNAELRPPALETKERLAFERALAETDFVQAERVILRMALRTHALVWCHNAERRLAHRRRRALVVTAADSER